MNPRAAVESRLGVQPIEVLAQKRHELVGQVAGLRAKHGAFGTFEASRKVKLATVKMRIRASYVARGVRVSNDQIDDEAHADPAYIQCITDATRERAELQVLEDKVQYIEDLIRRDNGLTSFLTREAQLQ